MRWLLVVVGLMLVAGWLFLKSPRGRRAALGATPMGLYRRGREQGATDEEAIFEAIRVLRHREPWRSLSDADLQYAARELAGLPDPSDFVAVVIEVEERRDLAPIRDRAMLAQFVRGSRAVAEQRP